MMKTTKTALVLGATGGIGGEVARQLVAAGWRGRALNRGPAKGGGRDGLGGPQGDPLSAPGVPPPAGGWPVHGHAVNPPGVRPRAELVLPMVDNTIAAARATGARIVL